MNLLLLTVCLLYFFVMIWLLYGWIRLQYNRINEQNIHFSVVIAARNEEYSIGDCLRSLCDQSIPSENYEILVMDDYSTDETVKIAEKYSGLNSNIRIIRLKDYPETGQGKKSALQLGISLSKNPYIAITDADCIVPKNWLKALSHGFDSTETKMICGPVVYRPQKGFLQSFFQLDLMSLVVSAVGAFGIKNPFMCNAANIAFNKESFFQCGGYTSHLHLQSGDDVFLLHSMKKRFGSNSIRFAKSHDAIVETESPKNLSSFLRQRMRWAHKSLAYKDEFSIFLAFLVLLTPLTLLIGTGMLFIDTDHISFLLIAVVVKIIPDFLLLNFFSRFSGYIKPLRWFLPVWVIYQIYLPVAAISGLLFNPSWKGR